MMALRQRVRVGLLACGLAVGLAGCAAPEPSWRGLDVSSGQFIVLRHNTSRRGDFAGYYRSPQLGVMRLWGEGDRFAGRFSYVREGVAIVGALLGTRDGNLLRFDWDEVARSCRDARTLHGVGYFLYDPPQGEGSRPRLFGHRHFISLVQSPYHIPARHVARGAHPVSAVRISAEPPIDAAACTATCSCAHASTKP